MRAAHCTPPQVRGEQGPSPRRRRSVRRRRRRMGWLNLGEEGPTGLITERVLTNDVTNYIRFCTLCRPWRLCSVDPHCSKSGALDNCFLPRRWIMLDKAAPHAIGCFRFLNASTGECIWVDLLELDDHTLVTLTLEGLLLAPARRGGDESDTVCRR
uniref:Uncharacterized protein n=1 Tax=Oryza punctata TaxID=4537 RepID=A0A0E0LW48_ORYPU